MELAQMASVLQNRTLEFPMAAERHPRKIADPKGRMISPHTGKMIPVAVAEVEKGDSNRAIRLKQEAVSAANG